MTTKCPKCKAENPDTQSFCGDCGTQLIQSKDIPAQTRTIETPIQELPRGTLYADRYEIIEELGEGGMGKVFRVDDTKIHEEVALKLIKPEIAADKKTIERFRNELKIARNISHKNICRMYHLEEHNGSHFITMEYVQGEDLKSLIRRVRIDTGTTIKIAKQVCEGLSEAYRLGIVHRDLKPSNIMIDKDGNARIMDFGIARSLKGKGITGVGVMIGTPEYMSPEQVECKDVDHRSDIYSLGVILYEMVTGQAPFDGDTPLSIAHKHKYEIPPEPNKINTQIPKDLNSVILKCLEKEKETRYQSAGELLAELESIEKGIPTTERKVPAGKPFTSKEITISFNIKKFFVPAAVLVILICVVLIILKFLPQTKPEYAPKIKNSLAIISFENQTGDKAFDHLQEMIPNLLITNIENSGKNYVLTWERMRDLLKKIGKSDVDFIDSDTGFEIC